MLKKLGYQIILDAARQFADFPKGIPLQALREEYFAGMVQEFAIQLIARTDEIIPEKYLPRVLSAVVRAGARMNVDCLVPAHEGKWMPGIAQFLLSQLNGDVSALQELVAKHAPGCRVVKEGCACNQPECPKPGEIFIVDATYQAAEPDIASIFDALEGLGFLRLGGLGFLGGAGLRFGDAG